MHETDPLIKGFVKVNESKEEDGSKESITVVSLSVWLSGFMQKV